MDEISGEFNKAVELFLKDIVEDSQKRLVIFIDDLDRCLPQNVIIILEAIKLFLDKSPCTFVIGIDRTVAEDAVRNHYGTDPVEYGRAYLDKIIQHPFSMPPASTDKLKEYYGQLRGRIALNDKSEYIFERAADGNPRAYFRLVSAWNLITALASEINSNLISETNKNTLAIAIALHTRFPHFYEVCRSKYDKLPFFINFCARPQAGNVSLQQYFQANDASEFEKFYKDASLQHFLASLVGGRIGNNAGRVVGDSGILKQALDLTARVE